MRIIPIAVALGAALSVAVAQDMISWEEADKHVGQEAIVEGRVVDVHCSPLSCLLAFEPSFNRFTAVVQASSFAALPPENLKTRFTGKRVRVEGRIVQREGKPEIVVDKPDAIALAREKRREERAAEGAARAQAETMERLADVLERIEQLTERMADVQERMETLLASMEERESALAAAQTPPPPPPAAGVPPPRPAFESLRTLKRGMSRADVERLMGEPEYVETGGRGWTTWYYGQGRSVSFNNRGRVEALVGFPGS